MSPARVGTKDEMEKTVGPSSARAPAARLEAKAVPVADDLLRLFKRTLRDQTRQQKRLLAGEIALVIPNEGMMQGRPDPVWLEALHAFVRRELGLTGSSRAPAGTSATDARTVKAEELNNAAKEQQAQLVSPGSKGGGRPMLSADKARRNLLSAMTRFRQRHDVTERLTNVALAKAATVSADTISNWLAYAGWTLDKLDVEWARRRPKKPE